mmetsp:Transcript_1290/g.4049  ORF Transcript_1290/g.4049 Transcript_1290/m.4049 type:complete len:215 (-) Transcript_1290:334-978(-)
MAHKAQMQTRQPPKSSSRPFGRCPGTAPSSSLVQPSPSSRVQCTCSSSSGRPRSPLPRGTSHPMASSSQPSWLQPCVAPASSVSCPQRCAQSSSLSPPLSSPLGLSRSRRSPRPCPSTSCASSSSKHASVSTSPLWACSNHSSCPRRCGQRCTTSSGCRSTSSSSPCCSTPSHSSWPSASARRCSHWLLLHFSICHACVPRATACARARTKTWA